MRQQLSLNVWILANTGLCVWDSFTLGLFACYQCNIKRKGKRLSTEKPKQGSSPPSVCRAQQGLAALWLPSASAGSDCGHGGESELPESHIPSTALVGPSSACQTPQFQLAPISSTASGGCQELRGVPGQAKARPARCAEAEPVQVCWCTPRGRAVPRKVLCKAAWLGQFQCWEFALVFSQTCKTFWMVLTWVCLSLTLNPDREMSRAHLQWCHHWGRGRSLGHPERPRACCQSHSKVVQAAICISVYLADVQNSKSLKSDLHMVEKSILLPPQRPWWGRILWLSAGALQSATVAKCKAGGRLGDTVALRLQFVCAGIAPQGLDSNVTCYRHFSGNQEKQSTK